jgi:hypothetical protein
VLKKDGKVDGQNFPVILHPSLAAKETNFYFDNFPSISVKNQNISYNYITGKIILKYLFRFRFYEILAKG